MPKEAKRPKTNRQARNYIIKFIIFTHLIAIFRSNRMPDVEMMDFNESKVSSMEKVQQPTMSPFLKSTPHQVSLLFFNIFIFIYSFVLLIIIAATRSNNRLEQ